MKQVIIIDLLDIKKYDKGYEFHERRKLQELRQYEYAFINYINCISN